MIMKLLAKTLLMIIVMMITFLNVMMLLMPGIYVQWAINTAIASAVLCCIVTCVAIITPVPKKKKTDTWMDYKSDMTVFVDADSNEMPKVMSSNRLPTGEYAAWVKKR